MVREEISSRSKLGPDNKDTEVTVQLCLGDAPQRGLSKEVLW